jgi:hypothetical protein
VIYDQRDPEPEPATAPELRLPWRPAETPLAPDGGDPDLSDEVLATASYAAVDRIDGDVATLAVAGWPTVEPATGRLDFGPPAVRRVVTVDLPRLQSRLDEDRAATGQLVRPVRVGDVFLGIDLAGPISRWSRLIDLTRAGRLAAKAALFSTVAPAPSAETAESFGLDPEHVRTPQGASAAAVPTDEVAPPGPVAYPAV